MPRIYKPFNMPGSKRPLDPDARREYDLAACRAYKAKHKKRMKELRAAHYAAHREESLTVTKVWFENNPQKKIEYNRRYRDRNSEKIKAYKQTNKTQRNEQVRNRYWSDLGYRIEKLLRASYSQALRLGSAKKNCCVKDLVGCTTPELVAHIERQFKHQMSWDNWGKWEVDHIRPCASFDLTKLDEQRQCFHFTNLRPIWREENRKKRDHCVYLL